MPFGRRSFVQIFTAGLASMLGGTSTKIVTDNTYTRLKKQLPPDARAVVEIKVMDLYNIEEASVPKYKWQNKEFFLKLNQKMQSNGSLLKHEFHFKNGVASWNYVFRDLDAREEWVKAHMAISAVNIPMNQVFSVKVDESGRKYLHDFSFGSC